VTTAKRKRYINKFPLMMKATELVAEACRLVGPHNVRGILREWMALDVAETEAERRRIRRSSER